MVTVILELDQDARRNRFANDVHTHQLSTPRSCARTPPNRETAQVRRIDDGALVRALPAKDREQPLSGDEAAWSTL